MSALSFLNPAYLGALALAAIPILIHLIRKRRIKVIDWAAWEFLRQSQKRNRRKLRVEQLLLLLVRILLVCLVALALSRPVLSMLGLPLLSGQSRVHVLIALDNSASMGFRRGSSSDFERARRIADTLVARALKRGDSASLVLISARPEAPFKEPTFDLARVRERIRTARLSDQSTDFGAAAAFCAAALRGVRTPTREVYWITDGQRSGFPEAGAERTRAAWREMTTLARVTWIDVAAEGRSNLAVEAPVFSRELVTPRAPVRIESQVTSHGGVAKQGLIVNLTVDGRPAGSTRVDVPANGHATARFVYLFEKPGVHTGKIQLAQPDGLERDDAAHIAVRVRDRLTLLLVNPRPSADPAKDEAFYLATALAPGGSTNGGVTAIQPVIHNGGSLQGVDLRGYDGVVITGALSADASDRRALEEYVRNGGGLLLFPASDADVARLNRDFGADAFLPGRFENRRILPEDQAAALNSASITHPALATLRDSNELDLSSARFTTMYDFAPTKNDLLVRVLCRFTGGQPALVERRFGQGRVILAATTAGASGTDLPFKPAYVPLVHQLTAYLAAGAGARTTLTIGDPLVARFEVRSAGKPVRLTDPDGDVSVNPATLGNQGVVFRLPVVSRVGVYRAQIAGEPEQAFGVNLAPAESELASAAEGQIRSALGTAPFTYSRVGENIESVVRRSRHGTELWRSLVLLALPLLFLEALMAQRFGRRG